MPTDLIENRARLLRLWLVFCTGLLALQIVALGRVPFELIQPGAALWHLLAFAGLTMLLWILADGRRPTAIVAGVIVLGALDGHVATASGAALATAAGLAFFASRSTPCAESSAR